MGKPVEPEVHPDEGKRHQCDQCERQKTDQRRSRPASHDVEPGVDLRHLERSDECSEDAVDGSWSLAIRRIELAAVGPVHQHDISKEEEDLDVAAHESLEIRRPEQDHPRDEDPET